MMIESYSSMNAGRLTQNAANASVEAMKVARDFEALFTSMMFKAMRGSVQEGGLVKKNMGEQIFTEMLDSEYAKLNSQLGTFGFADLIYKEIMRSQGHDPATVVDPIAARNTQFRMRGDLIERVRGQWDDMIQSVSARYGVDPHLVTAVIARESAGNPNAISPKGAKGLMQLMDGTAGDMGVRSVFSPLDNINGGVRYLKMMLDTFSGNEELALAAYNAGPGAVRRFDGVPPFRETQEYIAAVLALRERSAQGTAKVAETNENSGESASGENVSNENVNVNNETKKEEV